MTERLMGAVERPESEKARVLDEDEIERMVAQREEDEEAEEDE